MTTSKRQTGRQRVAIGNNPERSRTHNRRVVLEVVRTHGPIGRTRIAGLTRLTAQAVANIVEELVADDMLIELGRLRSGRGQPPIQFAVNPDGPMTAGVEVAADHIATVLLDITGQMRAHSIVALQSADPDRVLPLLMDQLEAALSSLDKRPVLLGLGIVMPGPFDIEGMTSVGPTTLPGWNGVDVQDVLTRATGHRVSLENDATAAAVGEKFFGAARDLNNFGYIYFGTGLGMGIIHDGRPFRGAFGNAGEIGHAVVEPGGRPCACGQSGCLERYASPHALREKLAQAGLSDLSIADLERLHAERHPGLIAWLDEAARYLSPMLSTLENILDPESLVLGGALPDAIVDELIARMDPMPVSVASRGGRAKPRILRGHTGQLTAALGAAAIALLETITPKLDVSPALTQDPAAAS
jgi:predicted NBD/HSP70 family sugar kinase